MEIYHCEKHDFSSTVHGYCPVCEIARLQAEANRNMTELCEAGGERDKLKEKVAYLQKDNTERYARIKELEGAIRMLTTFFPEGWVMPLGWEQMVAQAKQALKGGSNEAI